MVFVFEDVSVCLLVVLEAEGGFEGVAYGFWEPEVGDGGVDGGEEGSGGELDVVQEGVGDGDLLDGDGERAVVVVVEGDFER